jgi:hypothetical protein
VCCFACRERLFKSINSLPTVYETLSGKAAPKAPKANKKAPVAAAAQQVSKRTKKHRFVVIPRAFLRFVPRGVRSMYPPPMRGTPPLRWRARLCVLVVRHVSSSLTHRSPPREGEEGCFFSLGCLG